MNYDEMQKAVESARTTLRMADLATVSMVSLTVGRLRKVTGYQGRENLKALKRELSQFNAKTGEWKN